MTDFQRGAKTALPTALGYASIGLACGILASQSGLAPWQMTLMSLLVYSGSAQFILCAMILSNSPILTSVLTVLLVNLRNLLLGLHATTVFRSVSFPQQVLVASFMTDESYGLMLGQQLEEGRVSVPWMAGNNFAGYASWAIFTTIGSILGNLLPNPEALGVDFALIAMFVAIFWGQVEALSQRVVLGRIALILTSVALGFLLLATVVTSSVAVLLATLVGCFVGVMTDDN